MVNSTVRKAIESLYTGLCTITEHRQILDESTKQTKFQDVDIIINQPCRLSFSSINPTINETGASSVSQAVKLFIAPEINIPAGCKITVTQNNNTTAYKQSGEPAVYSSHKEIKLELFVKWA